MTALLALALAGCRTQVPAPAAPPPVAPAAVAPSLVVLVAVDQFPERLYERAATLATGGLARLGQGYVAVARHRHLVTETCPGHATISTGAAPDRTGIVSNAWFADGKPVYCIPDANDASLLMADALADRVTDAGGRAVAVSLKDRSAIMLGGHHPTAAAWLDYGGQGAVTGEHLDALGPLPDWRCTGERRWEPIDADHAAAYAKLFPDDQPFELADPPTFPHVAPCDDAHRFVGTPDAGDWLADVAIAAVDHLALGQGTTRDLLAVSFSEVDVVGHAYTPDSWEAMDGVLRLDRALGRLLDHLDATVGAGRYGVVLTADHGAPHGAPSRIPLALAEEAIAAAGEAAGVDATKWPFEEPWLWMPDLPAGRRAAAVGALRSSLEGKPGILAVVDMAAPSSEDPKVAEALKLGAYAGRSGDVAILRADGWEWEWRRGDQVETRGVTHGSTDDLDQRVPLLVWGAGVRPGRAAQDLDVRQAAPTAAALLGVDPPRDAELGPVTEALAR